MMSVEARIRRRLHGVKYECLFDDRVSRRMRNTLLTTNNIKLRNVVTRLEETQTHEPRYFWEDAGTSNLLTFAYWCLSNVSSEQTTEQNRRTLEKYPDNIAAQTMRLRILLQTGKTSEEANSILVRLEELDDEERDENHLALRCEGEIALSCVKLGPAFYSEAVERYQKVLSRYEQKTASSIGNSVDRRTPDDVENDVCSWHFHLAQSYNRMLNHNGSRLDSKSLNSLSNVYEAICRNLCTVLESNSTVYRGKSMIELADAFKKCKNLEDELFGQGSSGDRQPLGFPYKQKSVDDFVDEALREAPEEPYVLERCGRHYRQQARTESEYLRAIDVLDMCRSRHVAWHHKGLAYVHLSLLARNEGEYRDDQQRSFAGGRGGRGFRGSGQQRGNRGTSSRSGFVGTSARHCGTGQSDKSRDYVQKSKECYQKANELVGGTCCRYLVDLSRSCMALNEFEEAEQHFIEAKRLTDLPTEVDDLDTSYLYENWAILRSRKAKLLSLHTNFNDDITRQSALAVLTLYRKSLQSAILGDTGTKRVTDRLLQMVELLTERLPGNTAALREERDLLSLAIEYYSNFRHPVVEAVRSSADAEAKLWRLLKMLNESKATMPTRRANLTNDDVTAFTYLTVLYKAGKLFKNNYEDRDCGLRMAYDIARRLSDSGEVSDQPCHKSDSDTFAVDLPMRSVFRWSAGDESMSARGFNTINDETCVDDLDAFFACMSGDDGEFAEAVMSVLRNRMGLNVIGIAVSDDSKIRLSSDMELDVEDAGLQCDDVERLMGRSKCVIAVVERGEGRENWSRQSTGLQSLFDRLYDVRGGNTSVCVIVKESESHKDHKGAVEVYERWPRVYVEFETSPKEVVYALMEAMIGQSVQVGTASD